jgi:SnoaL-like domain
MTATVSDLMEANLLGVFNERDARRRALAIESTYAPDVRWTDDEGTTVGREALEAKAIALQSQMHGLVFTKASAVYQTHGFGYLAWQLGPDGGDAVARGFDAAIVRDGLISDLYTVITSQTAGQPGPG